MSQASFLSRRSLGPPNWLVIALITCFAIGWIPRGVKQAILTNSNNATDWLPDGYAESKDLLWFRDHFISAQFVLVSWDGCTLGDTDKLELLAKKLRVAKSEKKGEPLFSKVITGPEMIAQLTQAPAGLSGIAAVNRLEGALVGPPQLDANGKPLGSETRTTCLIAYLSPFSQDGNLNMRAAVERVQDIAHNQCGVDRDTMLHLGGPPVDNITIDIEGEKTLRRLAILSGLVGLGLAYWFFRSVSTTLAVFMVAGASAGASLALVYYYNVVFETFLFGMPRPKYGTVDAILLSMPAVVYVLGLAGAIHLVNYYRDERDEHGRSGAVERAVRIAWGPCALAAVTTAVGLGSLAGSDIIPIMKFGGFTAAGVLVSIGVLFTVLPIFLHTFPPKLAGDDKPGSTGHGMALPRWAVRYRDYITTHPNRIALGCVAAMLLAALGLPRIETSVQLLKLLDKDVKLIHDYAWLEGHLGNLVPMEVVVALSPDQLCGPDELRDNGSGKYRMTMFERMRMVERIQQQVETLPDVSRAMSAATFRPEDQVASSATERRATEFAVSQALEESREDLVEYMRTELPSKTREGDPRELWRVSARVGALADIDYGQFVGELRDAVEPVLDAYRTRDRLVEALNKDGKSLHGATVGIVLDDLDDQGRTKSLLADLLVESNIRQRRRGGLLPIDPKGLTAMSKTDRQAQLQQIARFDAVVAGTPTAAAKLKRLAPELTVIEPVEDSEKPTSDGPMMAATSPISTIYTGIVPLVYKTQRELLASLRESILYATVLIAGVMVLLFRNLGGGLVSMIPNVFPIVMVFGVIGWLGIKVDIGIMMTASVALGVAVDDTIHYLTWFRRGVKQGMDRQSAARMAFERCGVAMTQTTLIAGLGLAVFSTSTFTPTQQFGMLMITILSAALVGDLLMLPAILCGPLGWFFAPKVPAKPARSQPALGPPAMAPAETPSQPIPQQEEMLAEIDPEPTASSQADQPLSASNAALRAKLKGLRRHG